MTVDRRNIPSFEMGGVIAAEAESLETKLGAMIIFRGKKLTKKIGIEVLKPREDHTVKELVDTLKEGNHYTTISKNTSGLKTVIYTDGRNFEEVVSLVKNYCGLDR